MKRCLLFGRKAMTNLDSTWKSRDITLPYSQSYCFSSSHVQVWELNHKEGWALNNWCFWTVVLKKILESPLDCKESKPVNPKEINLEYSLEGLMLKLKLQYFGRLMRKANSLERPWCWERLRAGGERGDRGWNSWTVLLTLWTWVWANSGRWWRTGKCGVLPSMTFQRTWQLNRNNTYPLSTPLYYASITPNFSCYLNGRWSLPLLSFLIDSSFCLGVLSLSHAWQFFTV